MPVRKDLSGVKFHKLTAVRDVGKLGVRGRLWLCWCDCGGEVNVVAGHLLQGHTRSCGCLIGETLRANPPKLTHGHTTKANKPLALEYGIWATMKQRCSSPKVRSYKRYGGRGIKVCERWQSFENFFEDMGKKPDGYSLDRIDPEGDYEPGNCRWVDSITQGNNRSGVRKITANGKTMSAAMWGREVGLNAATIISRLDMGWSEDRAVNTPSRTMNARKH